MKSFVYKRREWLTNLKINRMLLGGNGWNNECNYLSTVSAQLRADLANKELLTLTTVTSERLLATKMIIIKQDEQWRFDNPGLGQGSSVRCPTVTATRPSLTQLCPLQLTFQRLLNITLLCATGYISISLLYNAVNIYINLLMHIKYLNIFTAK